MPAEAFIAARDFLLGCREDYQTAYRDFRWPVLDRFNWALDYFDPMARGNDRPGLWIVNEGGDEARLSFAEISERSNRIANHLRSVGVRRGDRVLLMLGNVVPLWESMLAAMKLGAVIIPATTLLTRDDLIDRFERGRVRHVIAGADNAGKFAEGPGSYTRIAVAGSAPGWLRYETAMTRQPNSRRTARPGQPTRCCCISPRAPPPNPSSSCTAIRAIRSAIWRRCTGLGCGPATSTSTSLRPAGPSTPIAASSRPGMPARPCSC